MYSDSNIKVTIFTNKNFAEELRAVDWDAFDYNNNQALGVEQLRTKRVYTPQYLRVMYHDASSSKSRTQTPFTPAAHSSS